MTDTHSASAETIGTTALAKVTLLRAAAGAPEVELSRRFPTAVAARAWCESFATGGEAQESKLLEIEVHVENWRDRCPADRGDVVVPESIQVGVALTGGTIRWSSPQLTQVGR